MEEQRRLPQPATNADEYLYDIALSLRSIIGVLVAMPVLIQQAQQPDPEPVAAEGEEVELKEPVTPKRKHRG